MTLNLDCERIYILRQIRYGEAIIVALADLISFRLAQARGQVDKPTPTYDYEP